MAGAGKSHSIEAERGMLLTSGGTVGITCPFFRSDRPSASPPVPNEIEPLSTALRQARGDGHKMHGSGLVPSVLHMCMLSLRLASSQRPTYPELLTAFRALNRSVTDIGTR